MKTPHAILIGLALIAVAIFFRAPSISPAFASQDCGIYPPCDVSVTNWPDKLR
jgi:hypothetical protein